MPETASSTTIKTATKGNSSNVPGVSGSSVIKVSPMVINEGSTKVR